MRCGSWVTHDISMHIGTSSAVFIAATFDGPAQDKVIGWNHALSLTNKTRINGSVLILVRQEAQLRWRTSFAMPFCLFWLRDCVAELGVAYIWWEPKLFCANQLNSLSLSKAASVLSGYNDIVPVNIKKHIYDQVFPPLELPIVILTDVPHEVKGLTDNRLVGRVHLREKEGTDHVTKKKNLKDVSAPAREPCSQWNLLQRKTALSRL